MEASECLRWSFAEPLYFILSDVIATPHICDSLHLEFIEYIYSKHSIGSKSNSQEASSSMEGEKYNDMDIFLKIMSYEDDQVSREAKLLRITYDNISSFYEGSLLNSQNQLLIKYIIYKYFKEKNYIIKDGLKFGVDYTLYHKSPSIAHGKHCILVCRFIQSDDRTESDEYEEVVYNDKKYMTM
ncbi:putative tRNA-INTRON ENDONUCLEASE [Cryptosporidium canis]|nr:putative tRNA-INTRON ENDONUCLEASE [Cryptosporidium canis]